MGVGRSGNLRAQVAKGKVTRHASRSNMANCNCFFCLPSPSEGNSWKSTALCLLGGAALASASIVFVSRIWEKFRQKNTVYPEDTVVLHQFQRAKHVPSLSPFCLKLETFLRMHNIPYMTILDSPLSSKGKMPWIQFNQSRVEDATFSVMFLSETFHIEVNGMSGSVTSQQKAMSRAVVSLVEESLYWTVAYCRWVDHVDQTRAELPYDGVLKFVVPWMMAGIILREMYAHGIGKNSREELYSIMEGDLKALSDLLGEQSFILGERPCEADCSLFGVLAQIMWTLPGTRAEALVKGEYINLANYCIRMRELFWPDWSRIVTEKH
ncbi:FAXC [Branchiostoma lanceolatum]|uniref:FAXC protein n=1 Tax=Branchiostoma lanceolatum TaxID=7740 RepID=A0A8J9ZNE9_BRALA|nr:FAXC [Branchiostoma lanceolatum]